MPVSGGGVPRGASTPHIHCGTFGPEAGQNPHLNWGNGVNRLDVAARVRGMGANSGVAGGRAILLRVAQDNKPRIFQDGRDIFINVALIVVVMLVAVGATGLCTYNPGRPEQGPVQEVDAETFLQMESRAVEFPVRYPQMPEGWVTNSARRSMMGQAPAPVVGWVTPDGGFLQMTQTGQPLEDAVRDVDADPRQLERTEQVAGFEVQVYTSEEDDVRDLWAVDAGDARLLFTGAGTDEEYRQLIGTALETQPLLVDAPVDPQPAP